MEKNEAQNVKVLDKAFDIIELISQEPKGYSLAEITQMSGLNKSTVYRILQTLSQRRFLSKTNDGLYQIGTKLMETISCYFSRVELQTESRPYLYSLSNNLQLSAILAVYVDRQSVLVDKMERIHNYSNYQVIGERPPMYCTAHGKLLLSSLSSIELEYELERIQFVSYTNNTICNRDKLKTELRNIRIQGYALDNEEHEYNQRCIAANIYDYRGEAVAAITVSGTRLQITDENIEEIAKEVKIAATKISERLGYYQG